MTARRGVSVQVESPGRGGVSLAASPVLLEKIATPDLGKTAQIVALPKTKLPPVADYASRCAALIRETFPARSQHQTCLAASRMIGASPDTVERILLGPTKSPDARLMLAVMAVRATRDPRPFDLGNGFAVRVTIGGAA